MRENGCVLCKKVASGEEKLEAVYLEEWSVTHSIGGEVLAHVLAISGDHVPSAKEMGRLPEDRAKNTDVTEFGYAFNVNNGSDAGQEMFLYLRADVMGGRKVRVT